VNVKSEPVLVVVAGIGGVVQAFMVLLLAFNVPLNGIQQAAITGFVGAILALIVRPLVTPVSSLPPGVAGEIADRKAAAAAER
jgi:hypothetical protein